MKVKRPNAAIYFIVYILIYPVLKICFRLKVDRKNITVPKGPHIVVANHTTMKDFLLVMLSFYPRRLNAVTAHKFFMYSPLHKLLPLLGCIPKNMFDPDIRSVIGIKTVLNRGDGILLFPEGRCSTGGAYTGISKATGKLIKKLGVPVFCCYIEGAYTCMPHWRKGIRFGQERVTFSLLFSEDDIKKLSIDDINTAVDARLGGDEGAPARKKPLRTLTSKRLAEGLHKILYWCPACDREFNMESKGNSITCTACGNGAVFDRAAKLTPVPGSVVPESVSAWFKLQVQYEMQSVDKNTEDNNTDFVDDQVSVRIPAAEPGQGMIECGSGRIRLDPKGWYFDGELSGEQVSLFFPIDTVPAMSYDHDDNFQIYSGGNFYKFTPEDKRRCLKYVILGECAHWRFASRTQMTSGHKCGFP